MLFSSKLVVPQPLLLSFLSRVCAKDKGDVMECWRASAGVVARNNTIYMLSGAGAPTLGPALAATCT